MLRESLAADLIVELPNAVRLQRLVQTLREYFNSGAVGLLRLDDDSLRPVATVGLVHEALGRRFVIAQHPRLAAIMASREPVWFEPDSRLPDPYDGLLDGHVGEPLPVHDCMGVSLYVEGRIWGAITLDALHAGTFDSQAREELKRCTLQIEAAVRVTRLEQENRSLRLSRSDTLDLRMPGLSGRNHKPLIQVNCAALPESLAESELFGHVKGAFSGATSDRAGRFDAANGGTLFLDEVGELPLAVHARGLRTVHNGEIQRLGADKPLHVDVRIIAATNRHLPDSIREGLFRADLYHRLSVYPVPIPPLRERGNDVLMLAGHFLELNRARLGLRGLRLSPLAERALLAYSWPGNVRELEHVISRAALKQLSRGSSRTLIMTLEPEILDLDSAMGAPGVMVEPLEELIADAPFQPLGEAVDDYQRKKILQALALSGENWASAARILEVDPSNLHKLARRLRLK